MTTAVREPRVQFDGGKVSTPRLRGTARRLLFWIVIVVILALIAVVTVALGGGGAGRGRLSATNPGPTGSQALLEVLRQDGVTVRAPRTLAHALQDARRAPGDATIAVYDPSALLTAAQLRSLRTAAGAIVLIEPDTTALDVLAPTVAQAGTVASSTADADCPLPPVRRAVTVSGLGRGYRIPSGAAADTGCLGRDGVYSLVRVVGATQTVTVLGSTTVLTNGAILRAGNAALALGLFGTTPRLVWYRPSLADVPGVAPDGRIPVPPWVFPVAVLAGLVLVAAGIWRGRRLGPVVVERMPVFVRASETQEGRARLYQRSSARTHALDALRIGTIRRLATLCGLPANADVDDVVGAAAATTGRDPGHVRSLLLDELPTGDARLIRLSDELALLERDVARAVRPG